MKNPPKHAAVQQRASHAKKTSLRQRLHARIVVPIVAFALVVAGIGVYAWLSSSSVASSMSYEILQIDALINMYEANDTNYNGVYDYLDLSDDTTAPYYHDRSAGTDKDYIQTYYKEKYSFDFLQEKWAQSEDTVLNLFDTVTLEDVMPSKIYGYKYEIFNYVGIDNVVTFNFEADDTLTQDYLAKLATMEVRLGVVQSEDGSLTGKQKVTFTDWTSFVSGSSGSYTYSGLTLNVTGLNADNTMVLPGRTTGLSTGRLDLWLQIRQKKGTTTYVGDFDLPEYRIKLEMELPVSDS